MVRVSVEAVLEHCRLDAGAGVDSLECLDVVDVTQAELSDVTLDLER
jgi:hypothetical protein